MSDISKKDIEHIAKLARIKLTDSESEKMTKDLGLILHYVDTLNEVDTENVKPMAHVTGTENIYREDKDGHEPNQYDDKLMDQFPTKKDRYNKVKDILKK